MTKPFGRISFLTTIHDIFILIFLFKNCLVVLESQIKFHILRGESAEQIDLGGIINIFNN